VLVEERTATRFPACERQGRTADKAAHKRMQRISNIIFVAEDVGTFGAYVEVVGILHGLWRCGSILRLVGGHLADGSPPVTQPLNCLIGAMGRLRGPETGANASRTSLDHLRDLTESQSGLTGLPVYQST